jgi:branched-chain amino acid transport system permease protein
VVQYIIAGLVLGGIYAIVSAGLVVTYLSAGILNFAFGAMAYFIARFYYYLHTQQNWGIPEAAIAAIVIAAPAMGVVLYFLLFRLLRLASPLIKVVCTLGLSVTLPPLSILAFGNQTIVEVPGLAPEPVRVFKFLGVPVTMDQIIVYACVIVTVVVGAAVLRYTEVGLKIRAMVDSPAMTSLSGTNPTAVSVGVWASSTFLAGLAGVLAAPVIGLDPGDFTLLMAAAFAAVIAAKLRSLPVAVAVGLAMGVADAILQRYLPSNNSFSQDIIPSIPFVVMAIFLLYQMFRTGRVNEADGVGGTLDRAIAVQGQESVKSASTQLLEAQQSSAAGPMRRSLKWVPQVVLVAIVAILPILVQGFWIGLLAQGAAFGVLFLSFTLVTGEGGMVWLCMVTFGGVGGLVTGQLAAVHGWPVLAAVLVGGLVALPMGILVGLLTIRLGNLYVALVTLTFGLLMENLVFNREIFLNNGLGEALSPPAFASNPRALVYLCLAVFVIVSLFILNLRRSTTGMALTAVRWSEPASKTIGVSVLQMKVVVAGVATFVAGIGGALLAVTVGTALPGNYDTLGGVVWFAVLVTIGIRSNVAALFAGLSFTLLPGVASNYLPQWFGQLPPILFGLGAIAVARNPDGVLTQNARQMRALVDRIRGRKQPPVDQLISPPVLSGAEEVSV